MSKHILCADIGGTHSRFAHFEVENDNLNLCKIHTCKTLDIQNTAIALEAAAATGLDPQKAHAHIWGIAGPIGEDGLCARLTNAPLHLDFTGFVHNNFEHFLLVNDFTLQAWASIAPDIELLPIIVNDVKTRATKAILGAGTGLGTAALMPIKSKSWSILQAEGGHTDMPFILDEELDFANFATAHLKQDRLSAEDVLSARGISLLHNYVHGTKVTPKEATTSFSADSRVLQLYARFLGRFCKNWALQTLCIGGLYLGGGVLIKNPSVLKHQNFIQEFYSAPKSMQNIIKEIPVTLMLNEHAGLWGAAHAAKVLLS